jgi:predicted metal-dependent peptidase
MASIDALHEDRLRFMAARIQAREYQPYMARGIMAISPIFTDKVPTLGVDPHWRCYVNPEYLAGLTREQAGGVILHEVTHLVMRHHERSLAQGVGPDQAKLWNIAGDAEINDGLAEGNIALPPDLIYPYRLGMDDHLLVETYFQGILSKALENRARKQQSQQQKGNESPGSGNASGGSGTPGVENNEMSNGDGEKTPSASGNPSRGMSGAGEPNPRGGIAGGSFGDLSDYLDLEPPKPGDEGSGGMDSKRNCGSGAHGNREEWEIPFGDPESPGLNEDQKKIVERAVAEDIASWVKQKGRGTVPGNLERWANGILRSTVDWRRQLRGLMLSGVASRRGGAYDITFSRRSRKFALGGNVVQPAWIDMEPQMAFVVDTSGSMGQKDLAQVMGEIDSIIRKLGAKNVPVLACDTDVAAMSRVDDWRAIKLAGGGGTDMTEGIRRAAELKPRPNLVFVFTDGYTPWPTSPPVGIKVVVGLIGPGMGIANLPPWAKGVEIEYSDEEGRLSI